MQYWDIVWEGVVFNFCSLFFRLEKVTRASELVRLWPASVTRGCQLVAAIACCQLPAQPGRTMQTLAAGDCFRAFSNLEASSNVSRAQKRCAARTMPTSSCWLLGRHPALQRFQSVIAQAVAVSAAHFSREALGNSALKTCLFPGTLCHTKVEGYRAEVSRIDGVPSPAPPLHINQ